ncbi:molecular chaperone [Enterobacter ludwigii]|uniref:fimbrial biogenesis chaperone n=1 Tax=Enterobacter ludwigii TaxID=299767 RepID=UPI0030760D33
MKNRFWKITTTFLLLLAVGGSSSAVMAAPSAEKQEGVGTDRTRYIFPEGARQIGVTLAQHAKENYLVQAWVREIDPRNGGGRGEGVPFFLKQPLVKTTPGGQYGFQVIQTRPVMVNDRESVYLLSFKFIPAEEQSAEQTIRANIILTYNVKLFYRPQKLKDGRVEEASKSLKFSRQGGLLKVSNPTPYWITFYSVRMGGADLSGEALRQMVPPLGEADYELPPAATGNSVTWQVIDEDGFVIGAVTTPCH